MIAEKTNWEIIAEKYIDQGEYTQAINLYKEVIAIEPQTKSYYWNLGFLFLLQGNEIEAQMTWMLAISDLRDEDIQFYTNELTSFLNLEAEKREKLTEYSTAWLIRQHIYEINPRDINNILKIIQISIELNIFDDDFLNKFNIVILLQEESKSEFNVQLLVHVLDKILEIIPFEEVSLEFAEACLPYFPSNDIALYIFLTAASKIGHTFKQPAQAVKLLSLYLKLDAYNLEALRHIAIFYQDSRDYLQGIETARLCYSLSQELPDKIFAVHLLLRGLMMAGGYWEEVSLACEELELILQQLINMQPLSISETKTLRLITSAFAIPHIKDDPIYFKKIYNKIAKVVQTNIQFVAPQVVERYSQDISERRSLVSTKKPLKIGYLASTFRKHSVGWLARWLFNYQNKEKFETHAYFINYQQYNDFLQEWYVNQASHAHKLGVDYWEIAEKINEDKIDILVDLDSVTLDITCGVMALKPAPIQITWLGWDASGIPAIDYYIADPYVLPDSAQDYYTEKIWRLPQTYIAVDGFEVDIPTLRRDDLDIPSNAVVYLSTQRGYKRHPETTKWQMKILKEVPNSYFLIKGLAQEESIKNFFYEIAEQEGVDCSRLRFLPNCAFEAIHRANLTIADVVLDTYPYNGATTTLETLWMGIPLVTRVGDQFVARNSYTMMINAGITEGIAWSNEEYIEWGVRLGKDAVLRQQITWKLKQSRQTAPLWNAKQFTLEMEKAYEQMWLRFIEAK